MGFDVICGNPPYQINDGGSGASAIPVYNKYVEQAKQLNPEYITLITPSRWFGGGRGLEDFRAEMLSDKRIRILNDFPNSENCFSDVEIKGGICFFLWNRDCPGKCVITTHSKKDIIVQKERYLQEDNSDVFIRYEEGIFIYNKVKLLAEPTFDTFVSSQRPFGLRTYVHGCKEYKPNQIMLYERGGTGYIDRDEITQNKSWIDLPKVFISAAYNAGDKYPHQILGKPIESHPGSACAETYVVIGPFDSQSTVKNVISYIRTKFF